MQENTTTNRDGGPSLSSILPLEPEPEGAGGCVAEVPANLVVPEPSTADTSTHLVAPSPAPVEPPSAPAVPTIVAEVPAELVAAAAEAIPDVSREWVRSLLADCGSYGLDLALLVVAWVKIQRAEKPGRYARVALSGWLNKLRDGVLTLEDVRTEVHGRWAPERCRGRSTRPRAWHGWHARAGSW